MAQITTYLIFVALYVVHVHAAMSLRTDVDCVLNQTFEGLEDGLGQCEKCTCVAPFGDSSLNTLSCTTPSPAVMVGMESVLDLDTCTYKFVDPGSNEPTTDGVDDDGDKGDENSGDEGDEDSCEEDDENSGDEGDENSGEEDDENSGEEDDENSGEEDDENSGEEDDENSGEED